MLSCSPAVTARASPASPSTRSTPRDSAATSSRRRPTRASSSASWTSRTSTTSKGCRPPSPSTKSRLPQPALHRRHHHRGLRLPARLVRPSAGRTARCAASRSRQTRRDRRPGAGAAERTRFLVLAPVVRAARASSRTCSPSCRARASPGPASTARRRRSPSRPKLDKQVKHTIELVVDRLVAKGADDRSSKRRLPTRPRPPSAWPVATWSSSSSTRRRRPPARAPLSEKMACPNATRCRWTRSSRARSRSTARSALPRVHRHRHRARGRPRAFIPDDDLSSRREPSRRGPPAPARPTTSSGSCRPGRGLAFSIDTPWRALPQRARDAVLHGKNDKVTCATATGSAASAPTPPASRASCRVMRRHAETDSDSRERY